MSELSLDIEEQEKYSSTRPEGHWVEWFERVMESCENRARHYYAIAFNDYCNEYYRSAIRHLDEALNLKPDFTEAYNFREEVWHQFLRRRLSDERGDRGPDYKEYQQSEAWKAKRDKVLERDGRLCICGDEATQVHHKTYDNIAKEPLSDLVALCKHCHDGYHGRHSEPLRWRDIKSS